MISRLKISFVWTRSIIDIFDYSKSKNSDYLLRDCYTADKLFRCIASGEAATNYMLPWLRFETNNFWYHYLQHRFPRDYSEMSKCIVPFYFRLKTWISLKSEKFGSFTVTAEPYLYEHGVSLAINISTVCRSDFDIDDLKLLLDELYNTDNYCFECAEIGKFENISLKGLSTVILDYFVSKVIKVQASSIPQYKPFAVITVQQGEATGTISEDMLIQVKDIFKLLKQGYKEIVPVDNDKDIYENVMFSTAKGRLIWCANEDRTPIKSIDCYHKNILRLSMQIETMADLIDQYILNSSNENNRLYYYVSNAQNEMIKLYAAKKIGRNTTYCSASSVAQINQNGYLELLRELREALHIGREQKLITLGDIASR